MTALLCSRCHLRPRWSRHGRCKLCWECAGNYKVLECLGKRRDTPRAKKQRVNAELRLDSDKYAQKAATERRLSESPVSLALIERRGDATLAETAVALGVTIQGVQHIERTALGKLRAEFERLGVGPEDLE